MKKILLALFLAGASLANAATRRNPPPLTGYVVHFDFIENTQDGVDLVHLAKRAGAKVINLVPPAHVWDRPDAQAMLDDIIQEISDRHLKLVIARVDAAYPPDRNGLRENYLYKNILNRPGIMPDGSPTVDWFLATAGRKDYEQWMDEETAYYAKHYGWLPNLIGIVIGPFSEPFVSQRAGYLQFDAATDRYELTQYTPEAEHMWHAWLPAHYSTLGAMNGAYGSKFSSWDAVPMPKNETDARFGHADAAFTDFVRTLNDGYIGDYERCRKIWHTESGRADVPFLLQFSGYDEEKFDKGRPAYAAFDRADWAKRADGLGLSLYLNSGYADLGRSSVEKLVRRIHDEWKYDKPVFVLEGGCEEPAPVLDESGLRFFASVATPLKPKTLIYEFLKDPFYVDPEPNSGRLVDGEGRPRAKPFRFMRRLFDEVRSKGS